MCHWETEQEDFLLLQGEALLIVEGQERPVRVGFVDCPPETRYVFVGAGDGPCVILAASSRQFQAGRPVGKYTVDDAARRHNACPDEETQDSGVAYAAGPLMGLGGSAGSAPGRNRTCIPRLGGACSIH